MASPSSSLHQGERVAHTAGPWNVRRAQFAVDAAYDYAIYGPDQQVIAEAFGRTSVSNFPPAEANANLIAAAPELLNACRRALDWLASYPGNGAMSIYEQARAAVAKAEGK